MSVAPDRIRNLAILAHINAGKTTLTERILFDTGRQRFLGAVDEGTATMDFLPEEQRRGISIRAAITSVAWAGLHVNVVDTPGHVDFAAEVERTLRVVDGAIVLVDGIRGVESQTEMVWRQAQRARLPALVFVNKLDRPTADWGRSLQSLRERLGMRVLPAVIPIADATGITALVDVRSGAEVRWRDGGVALADPTSARAALLEAAADADPAVFEAFAHDRPVTDAALVRGLRAAVLSGRVVLAFAGSALRDLGVAPLLDGIATFLPAPSDTREVRGIDGTARATELDAPLCGLVFRTLADPAGPFAMVRLYAGTVRPGDLVAVTDGDATRRVTGVGRVHADEREAIDAAGAGDIVALAGLDGLPTGSTLFAPGHPIRLEPTQFASPVVTVAIEPRHPDDRAAIERGLGAVVAEDPTLAWRVDAERDVPLLSGMGELHLEVAAERLAASVGDRFRVGKPEVVARVAPRAPAAAEAEWRSPEVGSAAVALTLVPAPGGGPATVEVGASVAAGLAAPLAAELAADLAAGRWTGWPVIDAILRVERAGVEGGAGREAELAAEAGRLAARRLLAQSGLVLHEPVVAFDVECPAEMLSPVLGDLRGKDADVQGVDSSDGRGRVRGLVPLARMLGYSTRLRSLTRGLGSFFLRPAGLRPARADA